MLSLLGRQVPAIVRPLWKFENCDTDSNTQQRDGRQGRFGILRVPLQ